VWHVEEGEVGEEEGGRDLGEGREGEGVSAGTVRIRGG
jgi:hypothetical protein